jgi:hypothetical protein
MSKEKEQKLNEVLWRFTEELIVNISNYQTIELLTQDKLEKICKDNNLPIESISILKERDESGRSSPSGYIRHKGEEKTEIQEKIANKIQQQMKNAEYSSIALFLASSSTFERHINDLIYAKYECDEITKQRLHQEFHEAELIGKLELKNPLEGLGPLLRENLREVTRKNNLFRLLERLWYMPNRDKWVYRYKNKKADEYRLSEMITRRNLLAHRSLYYDKDFINDLSKETLKKYVREVDSDFLDDMFKNYQENGFFPKNDRKNNSINSLESLLNNKVQIKSQYLTDCICLVLKIYMRFWSHAYYDLAERGNPETSITKTYSQVSNIINELMNLSEDLMEDQLGLGLQVATVLNGRLLDIWEQSYTDFIMGTELDKLIQQRIKLRKKIPDENNDEFQKKLKEIKERTTILAVENIPSIFLIDYLLLTLNKHIYQAKIKNYNAKKDRGNDYPIYEITTTDKRSKQFLKTIMNRIPDDPLCRVFAELFHSDKELTNEFIKEVIKILSEWKVPEKINPEKMFLLREIGKFDPTFKQKLNRHLKIVHS